MIPPNLPESMHLQVHIMWIAEQNNIAIRWRTGNHGSAGNYWTGQRVISIPLVRSRITYAVALHELGHHLGNETRSTPRLEREIMAWEWAKNNAQVWDDAMEAKQRVCLASYARWAIRHNARAQAKGYEPYIRIPLEFLAAAGMW